MAPQPGDNRVATAKHLSGRTLDPIREIRTAFDRSELMMRRILGLALAVGVLCFGAEGAAHAGTARPTASTGEACTIVGTEGMDRLRGTSGRDVICGRGGGDVIVAGAGNDTVDGGAGNDTLVGGTGRDRLAGGAGIDTVSYAERTAAVTANLDGAANDGAAGEADAIATDVESLTGGAGSDRLNGNTKVNVLTGGPGNDTLVGGPGDDRLVGGLGNDTLVGGTGNDTLIGGAGIDTVSYAERTAAVTANLDGAANDGAVGEADAIATDVESLTGGAGSDRLNGNGGANGLDGSDGDDSLTGGAGNDRLRGGQGHDTLVADAGDDELRGEDGDDRLDGGSGTDIVDGGPGNNICTVAIGVGGTSVSCTVAVVFPAREAVTLTGRIVDPDGVPMSGMSVSLGAGSGVSVDAEGRFSLVRTAGEQHLAVYQIGRPGYPADITIRARLVLAQGMPTVTVTVPRPVHVTVHAGDTDGVPLQGAKVIYSQTLSSGYRLWPNGPSYTVAATSASELVTDAGGDVGMDAFPGQLMVTAEHTAAGQRLVESVTATVTDGSRMDLTFPVRTS
jgi:hypothetical protein